MFQFRVLLVLLLHCTLFRHASALEPEAFFEKHCLTCHDSVGASGEIVLEESQFDWESPDTLLLMERVLNAIRSREMPPPDETQPTATERREMVARLDEMLVKHSGTGGTVLRRLNQQEYRNTIRQIFGINFELPDGFPQDREASEFDTVGESLILSPPLMEAYTQAAAAVADEIFPPQRPAAQHVTHQIYPEDLTISYSSGLRQDGALRLAAKCSPLQRSCTWPSKVEIAASGIYRIEAHVSKFAPNSNDPIVMQILARDVSGSDGERVDNLRLLGEYEVSQETPQTIQFEEELYEGQTIVFRYANAPLDSDREDADALSELFRKKFAANPRYLAAWQKLVANNERDGFRGGLGWERVKKFMASDDLDMSQATMDSQATKQLLKEINSNTVRFGETVIYDHFENGPALQIHGATIEGPLQIIDGPAEKKRQQIQAALIGTNHKQKSASWERESLERFLSKVFRRPVDGHILDAFEQLITQHHNVGYSIEQAMHLGIRTALISPRFLYREITPGRLDDYDLASRLAFFLTSAPPDQTLLSLASQNRLSDSETLRAQAERLLPMKENSVLVRSFTGQWLDTNLVSEIMPDPRLDFSEDDQRDALQEVELFFTEMLRENRPMTDFIDPDFTYTSVSLAKKVYELDESAFDPKNRDMQRVSLERGGRFGGILGQSAIMLATANGVDTQPVLRGVWVLENILGTPPPPPPQAVPAITPDTTGATTPKELLAAHTTEASCAACHKRIDPVGFALENFDAVGRWRESYPLWTTDTHGKTVSNPGLPVDASGKLPDGTTIQSVVDLKRWLVEHIDQFSECLAEKLMTYSTGRVPSYAERKEIARIVEQNHEHGNGFRDLVLALIESETFRTK